jgi:hypothetical protein
MKCPRVGSSVHSPKKGGRNCLFCGISKINGSFPVYAYYMPCLKARGEFRSSCGFGQGSPVMSQDLGAARHASKFA